MKWITTILIGMAAAMSLAEDVTVSVLRVKQLDNLDKSTFGITKDRADFYVQIWIDGKMWQSKVMSQDDGKPYWTFRAPANKLSNIRIKLVDDDGGLEKKDDYVDINKRKNRKDLLMAYNQASGRITGDVKGRKGQIITSIGKYDSGTAQIWFSIQ